MTLPAPTYDLVLMLDRSESGDAGDASRAKIVADAEAAIRAQGELLRHDDWGLRPLTYPIDRKSEAEYHLMQFHSSTPELLNTLDRSLRINDGVLRFRLIKLKPGVPEAPDMQTTAAPKRSAAGPDSVPEAGIEVEVGEPV
jgi:small subunit ribosomal protein S6